MQNTIILACILAISQVLPIAASSCTDAATEYSLCGGATPVINTGPSLSRTVIILVAIFGCAIMAVGVLAIVHRVMGARTPAPSLNAI